jgi:segregation and condensation protein A
VHTVVRYAYTLADEQTRITTSLTVKPRLDFMDIFSSSENRIHAIVTFLALLEMINNQVVRIIAGEGVNNFWIEKEHPENADTEEE